MTGLRTHQARSRCTENQASDMEGWE